MALEDEGGGSQGPRTGSCGGLWWARLRSAGAQSLPPTWLCRALCPAVSLSWSLAGEDLCVTHVSPAWWLALF